MKTNILEETNHLLFLYRHICGDSEVPPEFDDWCFLTMIAAIVQDRVWFEKFPGDKLAPNMFTFLLGPSALGKGTAMKRLNKFLDPLPQTRPWVGPITAQKLLEKLGTPKGGKESTVGNGKIFLMQEELAMCLGTGDSAFDFVKTVTGIYAPSSQKMQKGTVASVNSVMKDICVNWLAGTTVDWLVKTLPREAIRGGFVGRIFPVWSTYDFDHRVPEPKAPADAPEVAEYIAKRLYKLCFVDGCFRITKKARDIVNNWYMKRPPPENDDLASIWKRQHDMIYKIAMIFSLCEDYSLELRSTHIAQAIEIVERAVEASKVIVRASASNEETAMLDAVRKIIRTMKICPELILMRECSKQGITRFRMMQALDTLKIEQSIKITTRKMVNARAMPVYVWLRGGVAALRKIK